MIQFLHSRIKILVYINTYFYSTFLSQFLHPKYKNMVVALTSNLCVWSTMILRCVFIAHQTNKLSSCIRICHIFCFQCSIASFFLYVILILLQVWSSWSLMIFALAGHYGYSPFWSFNYQKNIWCHQFLCFTCYMMIIYFMVYRLACQSLLAIIKVEKWDQSNYH